MADTMLHMQNDKLCNFMTTEEIRAKAPYIFATDKTNEKLSDKYEFTPTYKIVEDMQKLGWGVVDCQQQRASKRSGVRSFHMVAFQNPDVFVEQVGTDEDGNEVRTLDAFPRIIITNSHDGFHSFRFMVGLFRLICSNGLVIATEQYADLKLRHKYTIEELSRIVASAIDTVSQEIGVMNEMQNTILTEEQKKSLAVEALRVRNGIKSDEEFKVTDEQITEVLEPRREEDNANDLWTVFNVLQERMIKGDYHLDKMKKDGTPRKARAIKGLAANLEINQGLFRVASSFRAAA